MLAAVDTYFAGGATLVLISFVFAILPTTAAFCLLAFDIAVQTSSHLELCLMGLLLMLCLILFYVRMAPKESWLIILTLLGFYCKLPYIAPIFAGLYFPLTSAVPIIISVYIWEFAPRFLSLLTATETAGFDVVKLAATAGPSVQGLLSAATSDFSWVFISFVFSMTALIVYVISHLTMDYAKELAIVFGGILCTVGLVLVQLITDVDMGGASVMLFSALSAVIMLALHFFDLALDYKKAERVEFSDDDNYYYVRVIPKLIVTQQQKKPVKSASKKPVAARRTAGRFDYDGDEDDDDDGYPRRTAKRHTDKRKYAVDDDDDDGYY
jgi:hypothetical protein